MRRTASGFVVAAAWTSLSLAGEAEPPRIRLHDQTAESGVRFRFDRGTRGRHDLPEIMGGGVALIDGDGDGWLDLYFCNGGRIGPLEETRRADTGCRYYQNNRDGTFTDATMAAGAPGPGYAMGAAVGDVDGDGRDDLFVTGWRGQRFYRNIGGGRFRDETRRGGLSSDLWSTSAAFADLDGDGDLDLFVANYVAYDPATAPYCAAPDGRRDYCPPEDFPAQPDRLYRNDGDGRFVDVSVDSGIGGKEGGRGLGVLIADLTGDPRLDVYVANDGSPCWLFANRGGLRFEEVGLAAGVALDDQGGVLAGMGVAAGDLDGDGRLDLAVGNFLGRSTVAFRGQGRGSYADATRALGLIAATRDVVGFGIALADLDGDGRLDLVQANGHVLDRERLGVPFAMGPTLLRSNGRTYDDVADRASPWLSLAMLGRGLAVGDLDRDGRPDLVFNPIDREAAILLNRSTRGHWLALDLAGRTPGGAVGARVRATVGGRDLLHVLAGGGSYLSASGRRLFLGLGEATRVDRLEVSWPSGAVDVARDVGSSRPVRLVEGHGVVAVEGLRPFASSLAGGTRDDRRRTSGPRPAPLRRPAHGTP